jgi:hypothetical protein
MHGLIAARLAGMGSKLVLETLLIVLAMVAKCVEARQKVVAVREIPVR